MRCIEARAEQTAALLAFIRAFTGRIRFSAPDAGQDAALIVETDSSAGPPVTHALSSEWLRWINQARASDEHMYALKVLFLPEHRYVARSYVAPEFDELHLDPPLGWNTPVPPTFAMLVRVSDGMEVSFRRERIDSIDDALVSHKQVALLGAAGAGKTTVLQLYASDAAVGFIRGMSSYLPLFARISDHDSSLEGEGFLNEQWRSLYDDQDGAVFRSLLNDNRFVLLLDGLNEIDRRDLQIVTKRWIRFFEDRPACQAIITCRQRDYDVPLRLQQVVLLDFDHGRRRLLLERLLGQQYARFLQSIEAIADPELLANPFSLTMLAWLHASHGQQSAMPYASLLKSYVQALAARAFESLHGDLRRQGLAFLQHLAWMMQTAGVTIAIRRPASSPDASRVEIEVSGANKVTVSVDILDATVSAGILLDDGYVLRFQHQLIQEVLSARFLAAEWSAGAFDFDRLRPPAMPDESPDLLAVWERLPPPPPTGWEAVVALAANLVADPDTFLHAVLNVNLLLGSYAVERAGGEVSSARYRAAERLIRVLDDRSTGLRERVFAADLLTRVGDRRLTRGPSERDVGPAGVRFVALASAEDSDREPTAITSYQVTVGQYAQFISDGGYDDSRWWSGEGRAWLSRGYADPGAIDGMMNQRSLLAASGRPIEQWARHYGWRPETKDFWLRLLAADDSTAIAELQERFIRRRAKAPAFWGDPDYDSVNFPVVGVTHFEAVAFTSWLTDQLGVRCRLPTAGEWRHASMGSGGAGAPYPWGDEDDPSFANVVESRVLRLMPVGAFPWDRGLGGYDFIGNARDWTATHLADPGSQAPAVPQLIVCGGAWSRSLNVSARQNEDHFAPDFWDYNLGFRVVKHAYGD